MLALKAKAIGLVLAAAVVGAGSATFIITHRASTASAQVASVPMPEAPPSGAAPTPIAAPADSLAQPYVPVQAPATPGYVTATPAPAPGYAPVQPQIQQVEQVGLLGDQQLDQLMGPIALYPDPLIAAMLPASTYPSELAAAALWEGSNPQPSDAAIEAMPWEEPIKALAHSPSVLIWMYNNPDWTRTLGTAFTYQPGDVMASIQRLRGEAVASGALVNTPQQVVVYEGNEICIEPATPEVVYVPVYDWRTVYTRGYRHEPITFFAGFSTGAWADFDFDWDHHNVVVGARWDRGWDHRWDDDHNAHAVNVRDRVVNGKVEDNTRVIKVGGQEWTRNASKEAPHLPQNVHPARPDEHARPAGRPAPEPRHETAAPAAPEPRREAATPPAPAPRAEPALPDRGNVRPAERGPAPAPAPQRAEDRGPANDRGPAIDRGNDRGNNPGNDRGNIDRGDRGPQARGDNNARSPNGRGDNPGRGS